jgi:hypothetical protein
MAPLPWVGDPPPPVDQRPRCPGCGTPLKPYIRRHYDNGIGKEATGQEWEGTYTSYHGLWHSLRCALRFATQAYKAGYRRK